MTKATKQTPSKGESNPSASNSSANSTPLPEKNQPPPGSDKPMQAGLPAIIPTPVLSYLKEQIELNQEALKAYISNPVADSGMDAEVKKFREYQAMILRDRISELNRHISVIKRLSPHA